MVEHNFYKESEDLATCKERKLRYILNIVNKKMKTEIEEYLDSTTFDSDITVNGAMDTVDKNLTIIISMYSEIANAFINYYFPESETLHYDDYYSQD